MRIQRLQPGAIVQLTPGQAEAFADKFERVGEFVPSRPAVLEIDGQPAAEVPVIRDQVGEGKPGITLEVDGREVARAVVKGPLLIDTDGDMRQLPPKDDDPVDQAAVVAKLLSLPEDVITQWVADNPSADTLSAVYAAEEAGENRQFVFDAITERLGEL